MLGELIGFMQSHPPHKQYNNRYDRCHPSQSPYDVAKELEGEEDIFYIT